MHDIAVNLLRLADGTLVDPLTREPIAPALQLSQSKKRNSKTQTPQKEEKEEDVQEEVIPEDKLQIVSTVRRSIMDLSLDRNQMAMINNVLVYTLWGLPDDEIAIQCNCSMRDLVVIRDLDDYKRMHESLIDGLRSAYTNTVQGIIHNAAPVAARKMSRALESKSADIAMSAMKDILDRAGHRPADRVEHTHQINSQSELVVRVIKQNDNEPMPIIELNPNA